MTQKTKIDLKDVPEDWRGVEKIRRELDLSLEVFSDLLGVVCSTYHDRLTGRQEGRYSDAFLALAEKIKKAYYQGMGINAIREFALEHVADALKGGEDATGGSAGEVQPVPGNLSGAGHEGTLREEAGGGDEGDRGEDD